MSKYNKLLTIHQIRNAILSGVRQNYFVFNNSGRLYYLDSIADKRRCTVRGVYRTEFCNFINSVPEQGWRFCKDGEVIHK